MTLHFEPNRPLNQWGGGGDGMCFSFFLYYRLASYMKKKVNIKTENEHTIFVRHISVFVSSISTKHPSLESIPRLLWWQTVMRIGEKSGQILTHPLTPTHTHPHTHTHSHPHTHTNVIFFAICEQCSNNCMLISFLLILGGGLFQLVK